MSEGSKLPVRPETAQTDAGAQLRRERYMKAVDGGNAAGLRVVPNPNHAGLRVVNEDE